MILYWSYSIWIKNILHCSVNFHPHYFWEAYTSLLLALLFPSAKSRLISCSLTWNNCGNQKYQLCFFQLTDNFYLFTFQIIVSLPSSSFTPPLPPFYPSPQPLLSQLSFKRSRPLIDFNKIWDNKLRKDQTSSPATRLGKAS